MAINNVLASVAVTDLESAVAWYGRLLEHGPESRPMPELAEWRFERGGWLQVYRLPERAGAGSFTLTVSDLDAEVRRIAALGIDVGQRTSGKWGSTLMMTDPDGNHIAFAEPLTPTMAR